MKIIIKISLIKFFICLFLLQTKSSFGQTPSFYNQDTLMIKNNLIELRNYLYVIDTVLFIKDLNFKKELKFFFNRETQTIHILDTNLVSSEILIKYKFIPIKRETFQKNIPQIKRDTITQKQITRIERLQQKSFADDIFGTKLERSGTISRGFSVGTNKDFTLNSGLRLQLAGQLSDDIEVVAVLSDQSSPIQPEGNTRTLQEIDKVYIDLKHKNAQATFGDFQYTHRVGTFGVVDKKLQGLKATALLDEKNFANVSYASARGKFKSQQFNGIDGVQGPYRLTGENNERDIIVLAGTEKVYINGEEKVRGENYDYTIDYSTGEIFFTPKVVITNASRIKVDFEYSDRKFERNFFGSVINSNLFSNKLILGFSYFREGDNQDLPIDISLSENDRKILAQSGNDRMKASKSGVRFVGYDSTGRPAGAYRLKDTLISGVIVQFYEFSPGSDSAFYNVSFSYVGEGLGDYVRVSLGRYKFVGSNKGNYLPIILLPMPELKQVGNFYSRFFVTKNFFIEGEISLSSFDRNRFSTIDDDKNRGKAYSYKLGFDTLYIELSKIFIGNVLFNYYERKTESTFTPISRIYEVEYERNWNINNQALTSEELIREGELKIAREKFDAKITAGRMKRGSLFKSDRITSIINLELIDNLNLNYSISSLNSSTQNFRSRYQKHFLNAAFNQKDFTPYFKFEHESKVDKNFSDSLLQSSFKFYDLSFGTELNYIKNLDINSSFNFRQDYFPINFNLSREANNYIYQLALKLKNVRNINSNLDLSFRQKKYSSEFKQLGRLDNQSIAIKYIGRGIFFERFLQTDLYYEAASQRSARLERIFLRVPKGTGQYIYKGDLNNNGIADEFEFEPTKFEGDYILTTYPTDELFPVIDLKASLRLRFDFRNFYINERIKNFLSPISTETYLRVEENSQDKNERNVYLLKLKTFQNPSTTIRGSNLIQQDLYLFEYNPDFNMLFRLIERRGFSKFSLTDERRFQQEKLIRLRFKPLKEFANQSEINFSRNDLTSSSYALRNFLIRSVNFSSKVFYYPYNNVEAGFKFELGKTKDLLPQTPTELNSNSQEFSLTIMYSQRGKVVFTLERTEMIINQNLNYIPFELTRGYFIGKNYIWRFNADYQFGGNIQTSVIYDGRVQGKNFPIHTATAEVRAFF
ncbi:MAG: hypothetical protein N3F03_03785 [Ignavibacteria bacterium]|nr:hypothetical protein [Ignavibacteria bacterium]